MAAHKKGKHKDRLFWAMWDDSQISSFEGHRLIGPEYNLVVFKTIIKQKESLTELLLNNSKNLLALWLSHPLLPTRPGFESCPFFRGNRFCVTVDARVNEACNPRSRVCVPGFICSAVKKGGGLKKAGFKRGLEAAGVGYDEPTIAAGQAQLLGSQVGTIGSL